MSSFETNLEERSTKADYAERWQSYKEDRLSWVVKVDGYTYTIVLVGYGTRFGRKHLLMPKAGGAEEAQLNTKRLNAKVANRANHRFPTGVDEEGYELDERDERHKDKYGDATAKSTVINLKPTSASPGGARFIDEKTCATTIAKTAHKTAPSKPGKYIRGTMTVDFGVPCVFYMDTDLKKPDPRSTITIDYGLEFVAGKGYALTLFHVEG